MCCPLPENSEKSILVNGESPRMPKSQDLCWFSFNPTLFCCIVACKNVTHLDIKEDSPPLGPLFDWKIHD